MTFPCRTTQCSLPAALKLPSIPEVHHGASSSGTYESSTTWIIAGICSTWCATILALGRNARTESAATLALLSPTCFLRNRNWRFRLLVSIVSMSICEVSHRCSVVHVIELISDHWQLCRVVMKLTSSMSSKPDNTRVFRSSQPMPPAPTQRTFADLIWNSKQTTRLKEALSHKEDCKGVCNL